MKPSACQLLFGATKKKKRKINVSTILCRSGFHVSNAAKIYIRHGQEMLNFKQTLFVCVNIVASRS